MKTSGGLPGDGGSASAGDGLQLELRPIQTRVHDDGHDRHTATPGQPGPLQRQRQPQQLAGLAYPPRVHVRGNSYSSYSALPPTSGTPNAKPQATKFAPLPDSSRKQFARDSAISLLQDDSEEKRMQEKRQYGLRLAGEKPSSTDSLPLKRVASHGRDSVLEMDLADEPMSAYEQAAPSMHEQAKRRRHGHHHHHYHHPHLRRRTPSVASKQTKRTVRSRAGRAIERIRRRRNSSSSSSSSSSGSSSSSSSSGIDWKFWRSSTASSATDDNYIPPEPTFTLYTPRLQGSLLPGRTQSEQDLESLFRHPSNIPHPYVSKSSELRDKHPRESGVPVTAIPMLGTNPSQSAEVFDVLHSRTLNPCLDKLKEFWLERDQTESLGGDLGAAHSSAHDTPLPGMSGRESSRMPSGSQSRSRSPDPSHPATSRRTRETGAAWWLDVQCASAADMRQLRRLIPMHPLTIEDILSQETREKIESYEQLGYYFIAFRALDETYFKYSERSASSSASSFSGTSKTPSRDGASPDGSDDTKVGSSPSITGVKIHGLQYGKAGKGSPEIEEKSLASTEDGRPDKANRRKGIVEIVEGHKEGVEGAGVGAINVYLVVFGDGIISFHFEDISNHANRVKERIDNFGVAQNISSHWIAYGLMDSIVDTFFPLIEFIEAEADDIDSFLANPLRVYENASDLSPAVPAGKGRRYLTALRKYLHNLKPVWLHVRTPQVVQFFGVIKDTAISTQRESDFSHLGEAKAIRRPESAPKTMSRKALRGVNEDLYDRGKMLSRIAVSRKLVMGLSRLLISKSDVVRGLRKRLKDENNRLGSNEPGQRHDIGIYLGDLQDHIITMQQTLIFFDTMLSHHHPAYLGILRLAYEAAKIGNDKAIVRLNIILVMFLPVNIYCGLFGVNVYVPHNRLGLNGRPEALWAFGLVAFGVVFVLATVIVYAYWAIRGTRKKYQRKGVANRL